MPTRPPTAAVKTRSTFRLQHSVAIDIAAKPERIWKLLTTPAEMTRWNSTVTSITGTIAQDGIVRVQVPSAPGRTFTIKVVQFTPNRDMVWRNGNPVLFLGMRTYSLTPAAEAGATHFEMTEDLSGLMLPLIARTLPDFGPIFERYAADLKAAAEA